MAWVVRECLPVLFFAKYIGVGMHKFLVTLFLISYSVFAQSSDYPSVPSVGVGSVPDYWGEEDVWWHGRASFKGEVISPTCTLAMESVYQVVNMGMLPLRELQKKPFGPEQSFKLKLRNCELASDKLKGDVYSKSRIRLSFDGVRGSSPEQFDLGGLAEGIELQIIDESGYLARANEAMPSLPLYGNEQVLSYTLRIAKNNLPLKAGNYYAAIKFKIDYL
jgi:type 1 fimbria pilin